MFANPVFITPGRHRFWESKWISAISLVCAAVLNESETPLKRNPVLSIYMSSSNAILLLLSSWFTSVAGPSLACGHRLSRFFKKTGRGGDDGGRTEEGGGRGVAGRGEVGGVGGVGGGGGEGMENNTNLVVLVLLKEY